MTLSGRLAHCQRLPRPPPRESLNILNTLQPSLCKFCQIAIYDTRIFPCHWTLLNFYSWNDIYLIAQFLFYDAVSGLDYTAWCKGAWLSTRGVKGALRHAVSHWPSLHTVRWHSTHTEHRRPAVPVLHSRDCWPCLIIPAITSRPAQQPATGWTVRDSNPDRGATDFLLSAPIQTDPGAHSAFCTMDSDSQG